MNTVFIFIISLIIFLFLTERLTVVLLIDEGVVIELQLTLFALSLSPEARTGAPKKKRRQKSRLTASDILYL